MNFENFMNGKIYEVFNWIYKMMFINLLWLVTTLLGFGLFTFMPATVALFILIKSVINNEEVPIFKTFFVIFKREYFKSQKIFLVFLILGIILYFNFIFYLKSPSESMVTSVGLIICFMLIIMYILIYTHIFIVYIYYPHVKVYRTFKLAFLISMLYAFKTLLVIAINVIIFIIMFYFRFLVAFAPLIIMSLMAYITLSLLANKYTNLVKDQEILSVKKYQ